MKSKKSNLSKNKIRLSIVVSSEEMTDYFNGEYEKLKDTVEIPGFRKGKAPRLMAIEKIGHTRLSQLALQRAIDESFKKSLLEYSLYPVTPPSVSISKHPSFVEEDLNSELKFEVEFDILPKAKIGDYKKIKIPRIDPKSVEVTAEEVDRVIEYLRRQAAQLKDIERNIKRGDWVELSFKGYLDNVVKDKLSSNNLPIVIGETKLIPGFEEKIIGAKKGESKEFELSLPNDFYDKEFAGKKIKFKVDIIGHKEINLPPIDKDFLSRFGINTEKKLRENIKKGLIGEKENRERQNQIAQISEQIIKLTKVDVPKSLIESEKKRIKNTLAQDLSNKGTDLNKYLDSLKMDNNKFEKDLESQAHRNIVLGVGLGEIAKAENILLSDAGGANAVFDFLIKNNSKK